MRMLADAHRQAAQDLEDTLARMSDPAQWSRANRLLIDGYWGAAFHWIAFGCQQKYGKHKEKHSSLVTFLRDMGEPTISARWETLENTRNGGSYGHHTDIEDVEEARRLYEEIRAWALS